MRRWKGNLLVLAATCRDTSPLPVLKLEDPPRSATPQRAPSVVKIKLAGGDLKSPSNGDLLTSERTRYANSASLQQTHDEILSRVPTRRGPRQVILQWHERAAGQG
jgi:hypothetical protein